MLTDYQRSLITPEQESLFTHYVNKGFRKFKAATRARIPKKTASMLSLPFNPNFKVLSDKQAIADAYAERKLSCCYHQSAGYVAYNLGAKLAVLYENNTLVARTIIIGNEYLQMQRRCHQQMENCLKIHGFTHKQIPIHYYPIFETKFVNQPQHRLFMWQNNDLYEVTRFLRQFANNTQDVGSFYVNGIEFVLAPDDSCPPHVVEIRQLIGYTAYPATFDFFIDNEKPFEFTYENPNFATINDRQYNITPPSRKPPKSYHWLFYVHEMYDDEPIIRNTTTTKIPTHEPRSLL